jgi:hypothetical protein
MSTKKKNSIFIEKMALTHMKKHSTWLKVREVQAEITLRYLSSPSKSSKVQQPFLGKAMKKWTLISGNANRYLPGKQIKQYQTKLQVSLPFDQTVLYLGTYPEHLSLTTAK